MTDRPASIDPRHAVLLVMDYQRGVVESLAQSDALLDRAADAIAIIRRHRGHVGYVRVAFDDADFDAIPATSMMAGVVAARGRSLHIDAPSTAVHDRLAPQAGDIVVRKTRVGAFSTTDLQTQLQDRAIDTLLLAGISTSGVVLSTVRDASDRDYRIFVLADASADPVPGVHEFLVEKIFPRQASVITTAELESLLSTPAADGS